MKKEFNKKVFAGKLIAILLLGLILGISCLFSTQIEKFLNIGEKETGFASLEVFNESKLKLHYIDVGQADSTFIELPDGKTMLIDAGEHSDGDTVAKYIKELGIDTIDYFILTHSDSDHSGGTKTVFEQFEIKKIYRPFQISVDDNGNATKNEKLADYYEENEETCNVVDTSTYERFINLAYSETYTENGTNMNAEVWVTYDGIVINSTDSEEAFTFEFFAPLIRAGATEFDETTNTKGYPTKFYGKTTAVSKNNSSPIMLLEYKNNSFLFSGDATKTVEEDFLQSLTYEEKLRFKDIEVFQAGHHGASESNSKEFLDLTTPEYVVVSCGKDNSYGHPTDDFIDRVNGYQHDVGDYLLRTDTMGNIVFGYNNENKPVYTAFKMGSGIVVYWWQIAVGVFVVISIVIISVKVTKNKKATAKRAIKKARQVSDLYKKKR